jgi:alpha-galactosidase
MALAAVGTFEQAARATQTNVTISMASPSAEPQIVGTTVFASKPGSELLFTVGATGQQPLSFSAAGLPAGVTLSSTGTLAGTTPTAGTYPITVTATNSAGTTQSTITLQAQDTLSATPAMGWNSYDSFGATVTESELMEAAQAQQTILLPSGYRYVVVDYLWFDTQDKIDANGRYLPSITRFPSATGSTGFTSLAARVHALGLGFGIHIMRGIPRVSVSANTPILGSTYHASDAGNTSDACPWDSHMWGVKGNTAAGQAWYDSILQQYAGWGIDFIKVDDLLNNEVTPYVYHQTEVDAIRSAIEKTGRSIVFSVSPGAMPTAYAADLEANANQWRMVNDFWDTKGLSTLSDEFTAAANWQAVSGLAPGHWPDADMLPLGYLGPRCPVHASGPTAFSHNQQVTVMTLWSILPSPLIFCGNEPMLASDAWTTALLTNPEVIAVNQDPTGKEAKLTQSGSQQTWVKALTGGRKAIAFLNTGTQDVTMSVTFASLDLSPQSTVRDAWHRTNLTVTGAGPSVSVPYAAAVLLVITPPQAESADAGGGGDAASDASGAAGGDAASDTTTDGSGPGVGTEDAGGVAQQDAASDDEAGDSIGDEGAADSSSGTRPDAAGPDAAAGMTGEGPSSSGCSCILGSGAPSGDESSLLAFAAVAAPAAWSRARRR